MSGPFEDIQSATLLAQAIVDTVREPILVLDSNLCVVAASRSFYAVFRLDSKDVLGRSLYGLIDGRFDIPALRALLTAEVPDHVIMEGFEIDAIFPGIGRRTIILNARKVFRDGNDPSG